VETEGSDRKSITLPSGQDEVVRALAKTRKPLITVVISGGPVDINTVNEVSGALLASWFNGSMGGQALAEILTGQISPSGKLPMTWPKALEDVPVAYPFGYGLSYAQFQYSDIDVRPSIEGLDVHFTLTNTSDIDAEEVAQVYVSHPASHIERPIKKLKGFQRVALKAGERKTVTISIRRSDVRRSRLDFGKRNPPSTESQRLGG